MRFMKIIEDRRVFPLLAAIAFLITGTLSAHAGELYTPGLPATGSQFLECRIVNITNASQEVTSEAFDSTGTSATGPHTQILGPGEAGGFSISAVAAGMYCKFTVKGPTHGFRASIDVLDTTTSPPSIVAALPAQ